MPPSGSPRLLLLVCMLTSACSDGRSSDVGHQASGGTDAVGGALSGGTSGDAAGGGDGGPNGGTANGGGHPDSGAGGASPQAGGAPSTGGGAPNAGGGAGEGGASSGGSGGHPANGGAGADGGSGGSPEPSAPFFPAPESVDVCPDPSLRLRFDEPPTLGGSGQLRVYEANAPSSPIVTIDMADSVVTDVVGGSTFNQPRPAYVHGNEAIFTLPARGLRYGRSYSVIVDPGVVTGPNGPVSIDDPSAWTFTTTDAPPVDKTQLRVSLDGSGQFCTLQAAIDAAQDGSHISIGPGAYYGIVYFTDKQRLSIVGDDRKGTVIAGVNNNNLNPSTRGRALIGLEHVSQLTIESLSIENQTPQGGSQAEALAMLDCDQCIVRDTTVRSLQDTLLWSGRIYAEDCLIEGNVDYIWGTGSAYFNRCEIKTVGRSGYNLQARNEVNDYGYVFVDSKLTSDSGINGDILARIDVSAYPASQVAYIDCEMGSHISPAGWLVTGGTNTNSLRFWEYRSRTPNGELVDTTRRAAGSKQLSEAEAAALRDPRAILEGWDPRL